MLPLLLLLTSAAGDFLWPLELPPQLTSSFGEYRSGRYHAGIDVRTGGIGIPVYAAQDGHVARVRCSPFGYGKAVYIQFKDGSNAVYGHLDDYPDALRAYVRAGQHAARSYTVDLYPQAHEFPVKQGDLIAMSGDTGIGAPHLHYELRDANQHPINPRLVDVAWPDNTPPVLQQLAVVPADPQSTVGGGHLPQVIELTHHGDGRYTAAPIHALGRIGFALKLVDHAGSTAYKLGAWRIRVAAAEDEVFRLQMDRLSYDHNHNGAVSWHPYLLDRGRFRVLWRWPGNESEPYQHTASEGWFTVPAQETEILITAEDFMGNMSELRVPVVPGPAAAAVPSVAPGSRGQVDLLVKGTFLTVEIDFTAAESTAPEAAVIGPGGSTPLPVRRLSSGKFSAAWAAPQSGNYTLRVTHPGLAPFEREIAAIVRGDAANGLACGPIHINAAADSAYGALYLWAEEVAAPASKLPLHGKAYRIAPQDAVIDTDIEIAFPMPAGLNSTARVDIYRNGSSRVNTRYAGERAVIKTDRAGTFVLAEDNQPPRISDLSPPQNYAAKTSRPIIHASISDTGSGIASYDILLGDRWLLTAYNPDTGRITWERDEDLPSGTHTLTYRLADAAGNVTTETRTLTLP